VNAPVSRWVTKATALFDAWVKETGSPPPSQNALCLALAQAQFETACGDAWPNAHNWGACDLRSPNAAEIASFKAGTLKDGDWLFPDGHTSSTWDASAIGVLHGDSDPNHGAFQVWFAAFPDDVAGAMYFLRIALRSTAAVLRNAACTPQTYATALYEGCYFGGVHPGARPCGHRSAPFNAAEAANIADYANAITRNLSVIAAGLAGWTMPGAPLPTPVPAPSATPSVDAVKSLQTGLNACGATLAVDGALGPATRAACGVIAKG
jgi:hypothetical protein